MASLTETLPAAVALVLVFEGVVPFVAPGLWKETFRKLAELPEEQVRTIGLVSMVAGVLLLLGVT